MGLKKELASLTESILAAGSNPAPAKPTAPRPNRTAPGALFAFSEQSQEFEREIEDLKRQAGAARMIARANLRPSPFQTKKVRPEKVAELVENLRNNPLATPLTVREIAPGIFEIIAGHTRDAAYGVLGRTEVPCIVVPMTDEQAERAVFFDNFFPPEVTDYEKYLGLREIRKRHGYTHEQLAEQSGISRQLVGYLMSFEKLPDAAHDVLDKRRDLLGAASAAKLAQLGPQHQGRVVEGLQRVANGELPQSKLMAWITNAAEKARPDVTVVKAGRAVFAKLARREGKLTIDFADAADAKSLEKEIAAFLKERAGRK